MVIVMVMIMIMRMVMMIRFLSEKATGDTDVCHFCIFEEHDDDYDDDDG